MDRSPAVNLEDRMMATLIFHVNNYTEKYMTEGEREVIKHRQREKERRQMTGIS